jgi:hypothetical protein
MKFEDRVHGTNPTTTRQVDSSGNDIKFSEMCWVCIYPNGMNKVYNYEFMYLLLFITILLHPSAVWLMELRLTANWDYNHMQA